MIPPWSRWTWVLAAWVLVPLTHGAAMGDRTTDRVWNPLWSPEDLTGASADQLARERARWDLAMDRDDPETPATPRPPLASALQVTVRTARSTPGDFATRWRLTAETPGVFRGWLSFERKAEEVVFPAHRHVAIALDRFGPTVALYLGDLDLRLGDGLSFRSQPEAPGTHTWQRPPPEAVSGVDLGDAWSPGVRQGIALTVGHGALSFGAFYLSMPLDGLSDPGTPLHPFPHFPTVYGTPRPRTPDGDPDPVGAFSQNFTGFWTGWHGPGFAFEWSGILAARKAPYLPPGKDPAPAGYQGAASGTTTVSVQWQRGEDRLQVNLSGNLHPGLPSPGRTDPGPVRFCPGLRAHGAFQVAGVQYQIGGRAWGDGFSPALGRGWLEDLSHPAQGMVYLQAATPTFAEGHDVRCRFGTWVRVTEGTAPLTLIHGGLTGKRGPFQLLGEVSQTIPGGDLPGQTRVSVTGEWRGAIGALRLQGSVALTNLDLTGSAQVQTLWRPSRAFESRLTVGLRQGQTGYLFDAGGMAQLLPEAPVALWSGSLRLRLKLPTPLTIETSMKANQTPDSWNGTVAMDLVWGHLPDTWAND